MPTPLKQLSGRELIRGAQVRVQGKHIFLTCVWVLHDLEHIGALGQLKIGYAAMHFELVPEVFQGPVVVLSPLRNVFPATVDEVRT